MSEYPQRKTFEQNLSRLLVEAADTPRLSPEQEQKILHQLEQKLADMTRAQESAMNRTTTLSPKLRTNQQHWHVLLSLGVLGIAAGVLLALFWPGGGGGRLSPSRLEGWERPNAITIDAEGLRRETLADGTVVVAHAGSKFEVLKRRRLKLAQGDLYLIVAKSGEPFVVETRDGEVRATGTRFAVSTGTAVATDTAGEAGGTRVGQSSRGTQETGTATDSARLDKPAVASERVNTLHPPAGRVGKELASFRGGAHKSSNQPSRVAPSPQPRSSAATLPREGKESAIDTRATQPDRATTVAVAQGTVELDSDAGKVELRAGQQGRLRRGERPTREPAPRLSYIVNWARQALAQEERLVEKKPSENGLIAVDPWGQQTRLSLRKYHVDVVIEDGIARTTIDQTFFNHYPWNSEGTFYFPLPPDASVSRLAMYVFGNLNEGGMVERGRGQEIYNQILYQRRDPALLEMMEGNVFKMRIFPLEGRQEKRIFLSYTQRLEELYGTMRYWFPMDHTNSVAGQLSINVRVKGGAGSFAPQSSTHDLIAKIDGDDLLLTYDARRVTPDGDLLLHLLPRKAPEPARLATCEKDGMKFVFGRFTPKIPGKVEAKPRQWIVLNDISASRSEIDVQAQQYILQRLVEEADDEDSLFLIDLNTLPRAVSQEFQPVRSEALQKLLDRRIEARLGATNLAGGIEAATKIIADHQADNPHILYLGDGVATDGTKESFALVRSIPRGATFVGVGVGKQVDSLLLQTAADATGGMFLTINPDEDLDWRVFDMIAALNTPRLTKLRVTLLDEHGKPIVADAIAYPSSRSLAEGETLTVVARCEKKLPAKLICEGQAAGQPYRLEQDLAGAKADAQFIPRLWAKRHIDELLKSDMGRQDEIIALSKQYYVVTPLTSLIVLEDEKMYEAFNVERGRQDHWALYPAPAKIEVVKEPLEHSRWSWYSGDVGEDAKIKATAKPKSVQEIVDSVQFRINAPFYYWPPQPRHAEGRYALYQLLDNHTDPTRLLTYYYLLAAGQKEEVEQMGQAAETEVALTDPNTAVMDGKKKRAQAIRLSHVDGYITSPLARGFYRQLGAQTATPFFDRLDGLAWADWGISSPMLETNRPAASSTLAAISGRIPYSMDELLPVSEFVPTDFTKARRRKNLSAISVSGYSLGDWGAGGEGGVQPALLGAYESSLGNRWNRIQRDIRNFNRDYGYWDEGYWGGTWNSIDLREDYRIEQFGDLEELFEVEVGAERDDTELSLFLRDFEGEKERLRTRNLLPRVRTGKEAGAGMSVAWVHAYRDVIRSQPGSTSALACDYLLKRRDALREKLLAPKETQELAAISEALEHVSHASARLEDSGAFWGWQGWNYRPTPWTFQAPTMQAYQGYNWSFDLTRYAPALYSTPSDVLNEVVQQFHGLEEATDIPAAVRAQITAARRALPPARIRFEKDGPEVLAATGDRLAITRRTEMNLVERMVCDGENIFHCYDELGLAARRSATELRLSPLRQLTPHWIEPAESLARRFKLELLDKTEHGFSLELLPREQSRDDPTQLKLHVDVLANGRITRKRLFVDDDLRLEQTFEYDGDRVTAKWFGAQSKELAMFEFTSAKLDDAEAAFDASIEKHVVFDLPLFKPSYYEERLKNANEVDKVTKVKWQRHRALALIQELDWRRWGGSNSEAQTALNEAFQLLASEDQPALLGDVTLLGSAGIYNVWDSIPIGKAVTKEHPVVRYLSLRSHGWDKAVQIAADKPDGLVGHMSAYQAAVVKRNDGEHYQSFVKRFPDSPLVLAATFYCANWDNNPKAWITLFDHPRWRLLALLMSAGALSDKADRLKFVKSYVQTDKDAAEAGIDLPLTAAVANVIKNTSVEDWQQLVASRFERVKESEDVSSLLRFAEAASSWGEREWADQVFKLAQERLARNDTLLGKLAFAQSCWASNRLAEAGQQYDELLAKLREADVPPSPALLAARARLAQQSGDVERAIEWEEHALALEHKHLPDLINLQAFRQRYNWLWQQYQQRINTAVADRDEAAKEKWLTKAETLWQRWFEVDSRNAQMLLQMAALQRSAGRDTVAWLYLSTAIDQRPRDANSYVTVGQWYRGHSELARAEPFYAAAYQWDTANPQWLFEHGALLKELGRIDEANQQFQRIIEGKWAPGLQRWVDQAKQALQ